ncbi:MAG: exodeoxyribonuclease III [Spirochaetaceae bacterium]|nr:MAG: exodeoxyribonuclease III [Spirochaetaceae bacterium]
MKLLSWNVNGLRALLRKDGFTFLADERPDILCLQETRARPEQVGPILPQFSFQYWNPADRAGYSGTVCFSKVEAHQVRLGMGKNEHDGEGRLLTLTFPDFHLVNVYTPNAQRGLLRLPYRQQWDRDFRAYLLHLEQSKPVVFCGDLNVAHQEIDLTHPKANRLNAGFTDEERRGFGEHLAAGFIDTFREFCKEGGHYTWWSMATRARERNVGWRIDYFCISKRLRPALESAFILPRIMGSDHCPVGIILTAASLHDPA